jgi:hypothetical protein
MSLNAIALSRHCGGLNFYFDDYGPFTPTDIGKAIVTSLLEGNETPRLAWRDGVTVNYLVGMLRYVGKTGEFYDGLEGGDHDFDRNTPTPGAYYGELAELRFRARAIEAQAADFDGSQVAGFLGDSFRAVADDMRQAADAEDPSKAGLRPLRQFITVPTAKCWNRKVGTDAVWWDGQVFKFGGYFVSPTVLGRMIASTLLRGEEWVRVGEMDVTVNYLVQMCREVGKHGQFHDFTDEEFDPNVAPDMRDAA